MGRTAAVRLAVLFASLLAASCDDGSGGTRADLAIVDVTVVDAVQGAVPGRTVLVRGDEIVGVVEAGADDPDAARVVDGSGRYLIPGLWDFHAHLTYDDRFTEAMPGLFLRHGITSIRDTGGPLRLVRPVVERMEAGGAVAPRVWFAGPLLDGEFVVYDGVNRPELGISNPDPETARANVARLAEAGVDLVKIYEMVTPEVFDALVAAAVERGLPIDAHVPLSMTADEVGPRVNSLEHLRNIEMACAVDADERLAARRSILGSHTEADGPGADLRSRLHAEHRMPSIEAFEEVRCDDVLAALASTVQVPTLRLNALGLAPPFARDDFEAALAAAPTEVREEWGAAAEAYRAGGGEPARDTTFGAWSLRLVGMMHERGIPIGAGTDTPIGSALPGYSLHSELAMLVRAGLSPRDALSAATVVPAEFFGLEGEMGQVAEGYRADLVLLSANPLEDIENTRAVEAVVTKGRLLDRAALDGLGAGR